MSNSFIYVHGIKNIEIFQILYTLIYWMPLPLLICVIGGQFLVLWRSKTLKGSSAWLSTRRIFSYSGLISILFYHFELFISIWNLLYMCGCQNTRKGVNGKSSRTPCLSKIFQAFSQCFQISIIASLGVLSCLHWFVLWDIISPFSFLVSAALPPFLGLQIHFVVFCRYSTASFLGVLVIAYFCFFFLPGSFWVSFLVLLIVSVVCLPVCFCMHSLSLVCLFPKFHRFDCSAYLFLSTVFRCSCAII